MKNKVVKRIKLAEMPFDKWDADKHCHVHATGYIVVFADGTATTEFEDDNFVDADDVVFEDEEAI